MWRYLFVVILLSFGSVFFSFKGKKYEEMLPATIASIIVFLYMFYILNILNIGYYILLFIIALIYSFSIYKYIKCDNKKDVLKNIFTPGFLAFLLSFAIIFLIVRGRTVLLWDELRLWGVYPKILFYNGSIQLGSGSSLLSTMQSYIPGMPLFEYFFTKSTFRFIERDIFLAYSTVGLSCFVPLCKNIEWKKWYKIPVYVFLFVAFPFFITNNNFDYMSLYYTLFIELIMTIYFGYMLYQITQEDDKYSYIVMLLVCMTMTLFKDTGIFFAIICMIGFLFTHRCKIKIKFKKILYYIIPFVSFILLFFSWRVIYKSYQVVNMYYSNNNVMTEIGELLKGENEVLQNVVNKFWDSVKTQPVLNGNFEFASSYSNAIYVFPIILLFLAAILWINRKNKNNKSYITSSVIYAIGTILFYLGYLFVCLFTYHNVYSYPRYVTVVISGGLLFTFMLLISQINNKKITYVAIIFTMFCLIMLPIRNHGVDNGKFENYRKMTLSISDNIKSHIDPDKESIALAFDYSHYPDMSYVIWHHNIYYELVDEGFGSIQSVFIGKDKAELSKIYNYDYIYLVSLGDDDLITFNKDLKMDINKSALLKVNHHDNNTLEIVQ